MAGAAVNPQLLAALNAGRPGQPPFGSSPLTMPAPNQGNEAEAVALVRGAVTALKEALRSLEPGSELFRTVNQVMERLDRAAPPQQTTPGVERAAMLRFMMAQRRNSPVLGLLAAQQQTGGTGMPGAPAQVPPPMPAAAGAP